MKISLTSHQARVLRMRSQRLYPRTDDPPPIPEHILAQVFGVQAQDLPAARLSVRARSAGLTASDLEQTRQIDRSIAWTWCMRGTLHVVASEDARWLVSLLGPGLIASDKRRLQELDWDDARAAAGSPCSVKR